MKSHEFVALTLDRVRERLPNEWQAFQVRRGGAMAQLHYGRPQLHYEIWVDRRFDHVEVGLHCEADAQTNLRLLDTFDRHLIEVRAESGQPAEAEHWTPSWTRVHRVIRFERLDADLADEAAECLARLIPVLQPLLESVVGERG